ncbi:glycine receptor subunit alphaZ1-like isoform X2 [Actinia tenebrosa]|uniref:Gamma-aminobutyric acid receptor subunit beta n=1 Tax=Actinia tenebrosa TaxID=6105 RepID=A0A6P8IK42_ACTTE|nr:glycine receptor subunit alphaZ1-like isoform X2 [Actinia tenebrosa]
MRSFLVSSLTLLFLASHIEAAEVQNTSSGINITISKSTHSPLPAPAPSPSASNINVTEFLNSLLLGYDKRLRPNFGGPPVNVTITTFIEFIGDIDEINMEFTTILYFRQYWDDPRLAYKDSEYKKRLSFNPDMLKFIWVPDTHFPGIKDGAKHDITATNEVIRIFPNGTILYSMRLKVTSQCSMDLRNFPMDKQKCKLKMEAFSYDEEEMTLAWHPINPVNVAKGIEIPSYSLEDVTWYTGKEEFTTGSYSLLTVQFELDRRLGFHMIQIYLPSYLIVILAWVSFWVDREQTAARIAMGITTVLTMATLIGSARVSLPKVSYVKSLEWFLIMCFLFVFSAILEYSFVSYLVFRQRIKNREDLARDPQHSREMLLPEEAVLEGDQDGSGEPGQEAVWVPSKQQVETVLTKTGVAPCKKNVSRARKDQSSIVALINKVEIVWRIAFPLTFLLLNLIYWVYYLAVSVSK